MSDNLKAKVLYISYDGALDFVAQSQVFPYLSALAGQGAAITLMSFEKADKLNDAREVELFAEKIASSGIRWRRLKYHKYPVIPATVFDVMNGFFTGLGIVRSEHYGIIHARGYIAALIGVLLKKVLRKKLIFDMRGFWPEEKVDAGAWKMNGFLFRTMKAVESFILNNSDEIIVLTEAAKKELGRRFGRGKNIEAIPCCVDTDSFNVPARPSDVENPRSRMKIMYVGSLGSFYDLEGTLEFFKFVHDKDPRIFLNMITSYSPEDIARHAGIAGIGPDDYAVGKVRHDKMPEAFAGAIASLIFYKRPLSGSACCPIKLGESLACGVPVIVSPGIGDCLDIVEGEKTGVVLKDFSDKERERAFGLIKEIAAQRDIFAVRCVDAAKRRLDLSLGIKKYTDIYKRLS